MDSMNSTNKQPRGKRKGACLAGSLGVDLGEELIERGGGGGELGPLSALRHQLREGLRLHHHFPLGLLDGLRTRFLQCKDSFGLSVLTFVAHIVVVVVV